MINSIMAFTMALMAFVSLASVIARRPWTIVIARRHNPPEVWSTPLFLETNLVITGAWAVLFAVAAALTVWAPAWLSLGYGIMLFIAGRKSPAVGAWYSQRRLRAMGLQP
jgi:hypothetical protein